MGRPPLRIPVANEREAQMTSQLCKHQCRRGAQTARLAAGRTLLAILGASLLSLTQPVEAMRQKPRQGNRAPRTAARPAPSKDWLQWGGPRRDFVTPSTELPHLWPGNGPRTLWSRTLGDGYSGIAVEGMTLYTAYRRGSQDVITALDARTGKTLWEYSYEATFKNAYSEAVGPGPYAMPQVVGDRLVTASGIGQIHSLDKKTGQPVWSHDLYKEFNGTRLEFGYSCHALPYKDGLILLAGGQNAGALALRQSDGAILWKNLMFQNAHSSPVLIDVDGQLQVVALIASEVIGFSPDNGSMLWRHSHPTGNGLAISTPIWAPGNLLFISSAYNGGSRVLELHQSGGKTTVKQLWHNPRLQSHFGAVIRHGDYAYLSSGHNGPAFMSCVNLRSGEVAWQQRGFAKAQLLGADDKLILLDEDGTLALIEATPKEFHIYAQMPLLKHLAWTAPTLSGPNLYLRDRQVLMALDLVAK
jgi:outer membrane protein assembly factor BamB